MQKERAAHLHKGIVKNRLTFSFFEHNEAVVLWASEL